MCSQATTVEKSTPKSQNTRQKQTCLHQLPFPVTCYTNCHFQLRFLGGIAYSIFNSSCYSQLFLPYKSKFILMFFSLFLLFQVVLSRSNGYITKFAERFTMMTTFFHPKKLSPNSHCGILPDAIMWLHPLWHVVLGFRKHGKIIYLKHTQRPKFFTKLW